MNYLPNSSLSHMNVQGNVSQSAGTNLTLGRAKMTKMYKKNLINHTVVILTVIHSTCSVY